MRTKVALRVPSPEPAASAHQPAEPLLNAAQPSIARLQRAIGNQATAALLARISPHRSEPSKAQDIRRRIGFEFEDKHWRPYVDDPNVPSPRPAERQEAVHVGHRFEMQGDDTLGATKPNIEFVTDPLEITDAGLDDLKQAMTEIRSIMTRLSRYVGNEDEQLRNQQFVGPAQHGLSVPQARLVGGHPTGEFKMQATQGVSLEDLSTLMETFGTHVPGETRGQAKERKGARVMAYGSETGNAVSDLMGLVPTLARQAVAHIAQNRAAYGYSLATQTHFEGNQARLVGFFSQVLMYVKGLTIPDGKYMKYKVPLLGRIDLATLFGELSPEQRTVLSANNAQAFVDAIVTAANAQSVLPKPQHIGGFWDTGFAAGAPLLRTASRRVDDPTAPGGRRTEMLMQSLTLHDWLYNLTLGMDILSPAAMDQWLQTFEPGLNAQERGERTGLLESFNTLGNAMDAPDRMGTSRLNVLENRAIAPKPPGRDGTLTPKEMEKAAIQYFKFMLNMKNRGGAPGKFPT